MLQNVETLSISKTKLSDELIKPITNNMKFVKYLKLSRIGKKI